MTTTTDTRTVSFVSVDAIATQWDDDDFLSLPIDFDHDDTPPAHMLPMGDSFLAIWGGF